jgi:hypothetical protein
MIVAYFSRLIPRIRYSDCDDECDRQAGDKQDFSCVYSIFM